MIQRTIYSADFFQYLMFNNSTRRTCHDVHCLCCRHWFPADWTLTSVLRFGRHIIGKRKRRLHSDESTPTVDWCYSVTEELKNGHKRQLTFLIFNAKVYKDCRPNFRSSSDNWPNFQPAGDPFLFLSKVGRTLRNLVETRLVFTLCRASKAFDYQKQSCRSVSFGIHILSDIALVKEINSRWPRMNNFLLNYQWRQFH